MDPAVKRALRQFRVHRVELESQLKREVLSEGRVSCVRGCSHCCRYPLAISVFEGLLLYQQLVRDRRWVRSLRERLKATEDKTWRLSIEIWMLGEIPCPLLEEENDCACYRDRPLMCRTAYSRGDPSECHPHQFTGAELLPRKHVMGDLARIEQQLAREIHIPWFLIPLSTAVLVSEMIVSDKVDIRDVNPISIHRMRTWRSA